MSLVSAGYDDQRARDFQDQLVDSVKALSGVESAAFARVNPLDYGSYSSAPIAVDGYQPPPDEQPTVQYNEVDPDYFVTMGIPLLSGREFTRADDENAAPVAVVNETMAAKYWHGANPLGERFKLRADGCGSSASPGIPNTKAFENCPCRFSMCLAARSFRAEEL